MMGLLLLWADVEPGYGLKLEYRFGSSELNKSKKQSSI